MVIRFHSSSILVWIAPVRIELWPLIQQTFAFLGFVYTLAVAFLKQS